MPKRRIKSRWYACQTCGTYFHPLNPHASFCSNLCQLKSLWPRYAGRNKKPMSWWKNEKGYIEGRLWLSDGTQIRIKQHRFIMQGIIGRTLHPWEDVHHANGIKNDNRPENLELLDHGTHSTLTNKSYQHKRGYKMHLTDAERKARALRATALGLHRLGLTAIAAAEGRR